VLMQENGALTIFGLTPIERVEKAASLMAQGNPIILVDDENRENEGDVIVAAEFINAKTMNFMIRNCTGIVCLCLTKQRLRELNLPLMVPENEDHFRTAFTVTIDARKGVTTGVSAADRALTVLTALDDNTQASDLCRPGHIFPLQAKDGGVLKRPGHTEGSIDLARIAGLKPAAVLCELMNADGTMSRLPEIIEFAKKHELLVLSIKDIIEYRIANEKKLIKNEVYNYV